MPGGRGPMSVNLDKAKDSKGTIRRVLKYLEVHKVSLVLVFISIILYVICNLITSIMLKPIIDDYIVPMIQKPDDSSLKAEFMKMLVMYSGVILLTTIFSY